MDSIFVMSCRFNATSSPAHYCIESSLFEELEMYSESLSESLLVPPRTPIGGGGSGVPSENME